MHCYSGSPDLIANHLLSGNAIRVLIADAQPIFRRGLKQILFDADEIIVVDEIQDIEELMNAIGGGAYDILILDSAMICKGYSKAIKDIKSAFPNLSILITSSYPEANYVAEIIGIGASGCIEKECTPCELLNTVRKISSCK